MVSAQMAWTGGRRFMVQGGGGGSVEVLAGPRSAEEAAAMRPKELVLAGLATCSGVDVVLILERMRVAVERFEVSVEADETDGQPKVFSQVRMAYRLWGADLSPRRAARAVRLSQDQYCGVAAMLRPAAPIACSLEVNGQPVAVEAETAEE